MTFENLNGKLIFSLAGKYAGKYGFIIKSYSKYKNFKNFNHFLVCFLTNAKFTNKNSKSNFFKSNNQPKIFKYKIKLKVLNSNHIIMSKKSINVDWVTDDLIRMLLNKVTLKYGKNKINSYLKENIKKIDSATLLKLI
mmetsp:Transcript_15467/g.21541  ORF Transcript_15467/g.21541 Transcript_15467/m.21541 type:complete len:138 (-) Transcript_15467:2003-2416(-)